MCTFIDSEVVLLNLLCNDHNDSGVDYRDLREYCDKIKTALFKEEGENIKCVSFQISKQSLDNNVIDYPSLFQTCMGRYYKGSEFNPNVFDRRNSRKINRILRECAATV